MIAALATWYNTGVVVGWIVFQSRNKSGHLLCGN
jgi:hypothetical protein